MTAGGTRMKNITLLFSWLCVTMCALPTTVHTAAPAASFEGEMDPAVEQAFHLIATFKKKTAHLRKRKTAMLTPEVLEFRNAYLKPVILNVLAASQATTAAEHIADCKALKRSIKSYLEEFKRIGPLIDTTVLKGRESDMVYHQLEAPVFDEDQSAEEPVTPPKAITLPQPPPLTTESDEDDGLLAEEPFRDEEIDGEFDVNNEMEKIETLPLADEPQSQPAPSTPEEEMAAELGSDFDDPMMVDPMQAMMAPQPAPTTSTPAVPQSVRTPSRGAPKAVVTPQVETKATPLKKAVKQTAPVRDALSTEKKAEKQTAPIVTVKPVNTVAPKPADGDKGFTATTPAGVPQKAAAPTEAGQLSEDVEFNMDDPLASLPDLPSPDDLP